MKRPRHADAVEVGRFLILICLFSCERSQTFALQIFCAGTSLRISPLRRLQLDVNYEFRIDVGSRMDSEDTGPQQCEVMILSIVMT